LHDSIVFDVPILAITFLVFRFSRRCQTREEVIEGGFEDHLPDHVEEAPSYHVLPEKVFENGEGRLSHPPEAITDPSQGVSRRATPGPLCSRASCRPRNIVIIFS